MTPSLQIGPFHLVRPIGQGGMATLWSATHVEHDIDVAIKILTGERLRQQRFVDAFRREVRAVARMNHPHIVRVFDYGKISEAVAQASQGKLVAGSPFMAMELADATLGNVNHAHLNWPTIHIILMHVLDGLAHTHARGLVHRDIKPDNILVMNDESGAKLKLTDFGIAQVIENERLLRASDEITTGTPRYMAPEQIRGQIRDQGPWTDLYAVGCLAHWLVSRNPPYSGATTQEIFRGHLQKERPPLDAIIDVPAGFERWTSQLLARRPSDRFRRAADAAAALASFAGELSDTPKPVGTRRSDGCSSELTIAEESGATRLVNTISESLSGDESVGSSQVLSPETVAARLPVDWREDSREPEPIKLAGVGLKLFELREIPLVGRHQLRDELWARFSDTVHTKRPHFVMLSGPAGIGKTRLARWLGHQTHEMGVATVLTAHHSPIGTESQGLRQMAAEHLRCHGCGKEEILNRLREFYGVHGSVESDDLYECLVLTELLSPTDGSQCDTEQQSLQRLRPRQRWVVWRRLFQRLAQSRPLVVLVDDIQWGVETLQFIRFVLDEAHHDLPVLFVATTRADLLGDNPMAHELVSQIIARPCCQRLEVGALPASDHRHLVEQLLRLEPTLATEICRRTEGNPLFAIQLVGDWIERDLLVTGDTGFRLREYRQQPTLPDEIHQLLVGRLEKLIGEPTDQQPVSEARIALELGATLGRDVDRQEWKVLCDVAGVEAPDELIETLASHRLLRAETSHWSFAHGALRDTVLRIAEEANRLCDHHRRCIEMFERRYDTDQPAITPRIARHLLAAREFEQALEPLRGAIAHYTVTKDYETAQRYFELYQEACQKLRLGDDDRRTVQGWFEGVELYLSWWKRDRAAELIDKCQRLCEANGWDNLLAWVRWAQLRLVREQARYREAIELGEQALQQFRKHEDRVGIIRCHLSLAKTYNSKGDYRRGLQLAEKARERFQPEDERDLLAAAWLTSGISYANLERFDTAKEHYRRSKQISHERGNLSKVGICLNNMGELCRRQGKLEEATQYYLEAIMVHRRVGVGHTDVPRFNLALMRLHDGDFEGALSPLMSAFDNATAHGREVFAGVCCAGLAAAVAGLERWEDFDRHHEQMKQRLVDTDFVDPDLAATVELAALQALEHNQRQRAESIGAMAIDQWSKLDEPDRVQHLQQLLRQQ